MSPSHFPSESQKYHSSPPLPSPPLKSKRCKNEGGRRKETAAILFFSHAQAVSLCIRTVYGARRNGKNHKFCPFPLLTSTIATAAGHNAFFPHIPYTLYSSSQEKKKCLMDLFAPPLPSKRTYTPLFPLLFFVQVTFSDLFPLLKSADCSLLAVLRWETIVFVRGILRSEK